MLRTEQRKNVLNVALDVSYPIETDFSGGVEKSTRY